MKRFILIALVVGSIAAGPCEKILPDALKTDVEEPPSDCTELGCENSLIVEVIRSDNDQFIGGAYSIEAYDEVTEYAWSLECFLTFAEAGFDCDAFGVPIEGSFTATLIDEGRTIELFIGAGPAMITLTVEHNGNVLGSKNIIPEYEPFAPNGPECEPICYEADEAMGVSSW